MGRQAKKCPKKCTRHLFSLKPVHYSAFFSRESQFTYCAQNSHTEGNVPKFNRDGKAYTAAFILAIDQLKLKENDKIYQIEHERFKKANHQEKTQIFVPKPKSKSSFCNNCKQIYDDYIEHISSQKHKQNIKQNPFNDEIISLCQTFSNQRRQMSKIILPDEFTTSFAEKISQQTQFSCDTNNVQEQQKEKASIEQPDLFLQKMTKDNFNVMSFCQGLKSFHSYGDVNIENVPKELAFLNYEMNDIKSEAKFLTQSGAFKLSEQTASPVKAKFQRPIILMSRTFSVDE